MLVLIVWGTTYVTMTELLPPGRPLLVAAAAVLPAGADARRRRAVVLALVPALGAVWGAPRSSLCASGAGAMFHFGLSRRHL